jgi:hypothetical protein
MQTKTSNKHTVLASLLGASTNRKTIKNIQPEHWRFPRAPALLSRTKESAINPWETGARASEMKKHKR